MPSSFSDVNFVPDEVIKERKKTSQIKYGNKYAMIFAGIVLLVGLGFWGYNFYLNNRITNIETDISAQNARIEELEEFSRAGYKLGVRLGAIKDILDERALYSNLITDLYNKKPENVTIENWQVSDTGQITLSATSFPNYIPIADFQERLRNSENNYYSDIRLRSASLDRRTSSVRFSLQIQLNKSELYESIE